MAGSLAGYQVAIFAVDGFEQAELVEPQKALKAAGAQVHVISQKPGQIQGFVHTDKGDKVKVDATFDQTRASDYDAVVLPGGVVNGDAIRVDAKAQDIVKQFVQDAGTAGATEIAAGKLALTNSSDAQVKSFAQRMIADHTRFARNLDIVAQRQGIMAAPSADASVTGSLESLHGADFNKAYIAQVAEDGHRKAVAVFSTESKAGGNAQFKNSATRALPIIKHHYAMAQQLAKLKGVTS